MKALNNSLKSINLYSFLLNLLNTWIISFHMNRDLDLNLKQLQTRYLKLIVILV